MQKHCVLSLTWLKVIGGRAHTASALPIEYYDFFQCSFLNNTSTYPFISTYAKFSENMLFQTPLYADVRVRTRRLEMLVFSENFAYVLNE